MWRVVRAARPVGGNWAGGAQVRVSNVMRVPVSFASTVLCPSSFTAWSARKLQAVMLHEGSHVAHVDSYVLSLAAINRAIFGSTHYMVAADSPRRSGESIGSSRPCLHRERLIHLRPARFGTLDGATVEIGMLPLVPRPCPLKQCRRQEGGGLGASESSRQLDCVGLCDWALSTSRRAEVAARTWPARRHGPLRAQSRDAGCS
jgi:hypothetical protein